MKQFANQLYDFDAGGDCGCITRGYVFGLLAGNPLGVSFSDTV
jgi:hypothetical protein